MSDKTVIILKEGVVQSLIKDTGTFLMAFALVGIGVFLASTVMQWVGAIVFFLHVITVSMRKYVTVDEARKKLDEVEAAASTPAGAA